MHQRVTDISLKRTAGNIGSRVGGEEEGSEHNRKSSGEAADNVLYFLVLR